MVDITSGFYCLAAYSVDHTHTAKSLKPRECS